MSRPQHCHHFADPSSPLVTPRYPSSPLVTPRQPLSPLVNPTHPSPPLLTIPAPLLTPLLLTWEWEDLSTVITPLTPPVISVHHHPADIIIKLNTKGVERVWRGVERVWRGCGEGVRRGEEEWGSPAIWPKHVSLATVKLRVVHYVNFSIVSKLKPFLVWVTWQIKLSEIEKHVLLDIESRV